MLNAFRCRSLLPEILDVEQPPEEELAECYRFLKGVNRWLGGSRALVARFREFARGWRPGERITVLDVGAGVADVPAALVAWATEAGFDLRVTACDIDPAALRLARSEQPGFLYSCCDVNRSSFREGQFDYVTCSTFFHHLTDVQAVQALRSFDRLARRGVVVNDILRRVRAWIWITLFTLPTNRILRHDGPLSVRKAFTVREAEEIARRAGLEYLTVRVHFGHRFTMAGEKKTTEHRPQVTEREERGT